ncbi:MAG: LLM class flavin-dependent oxidoreductase [Acidobacteria bacterium]|nr:LLM class flavin-dependent oxidoreductase [Acidobacteriota bacterium]
MNSERKEESVKAQAVEGAEVAVDIFSTCSQSSQVAKAEYYNNIIDVARWSEKYGCKGILVYTDNSLVDPWMVSQVIIENTSALCPLVAVQPIYMHPYSVAKKVSSFGYLYNRQIYLNMLAGGFKNDLLALDDPTPHDRRYDRMVEYVRIIQLLLANTSGVSFKGDFYTIDKLKMTPPLPGELYPGILVSGSSDAGLAAARAIGAVAVKYPKPPGEYENEPLEESIGSGVRVGIVARNDSDEAWRVAHERFPEDRKGELAHQLAMKVSDSVWHKQLSDLGKTEENNPYWLIPFQHYKTFCPYLVGSYTTVANELARYIDLGFRTFIVDIPPNEEELFHMDIVFKLAVQHTAVRKAAK